MARRWRARDHELLDALGELPEHTLAGTAWRVVPETRDPLLCWHSRGRWDLGHFEVLYTALDPDGAVAELYFHLSRQPVFPSKARFTSNEIAVTLDRVVRFDHLSDLEPFGVDPDRYSDVLYEQTQEIGDAAAFLGLDGLVVPSARWPVLNLVVVCPNLPASALSLERSEPIDWAAWREQHGR